MSEISTSLLGRKVEFTKDADSMDESLPGKVGEIVSAFIASNGHVGYQVEVEGILYTPPFAVVGSHRPCKLLPR